MWFKKDRADHVGANTTDLINASGTNIAQLKTRFAETQRIRKDDGRKLDAVYQVIKIALLRVCFELVAKRYMFKAVSFVDLFRRANRSRNVQQAVMVSVFNENFMPLLRSSRSQCKRKLSDLGHGWKQRTSVDYW